MSQERFHYKTLEEVKERAEELKVYLPFSSSTDILKTPLKWEMLHFITVWGSRQWRELTLWKMDHRLIIPSAVM